MIENVIQAIIDTLAWLRLCDNGTADTTAELLVVALRCFIRLVVFVAGTAVLVYAALALVGAA
ncbi:MAG: hypothetical protein M0R06_17120 [Sphaerochaeta sp.]|jgi:hypothetical protein|nr:hypothetical protein [Sphaerochaeta sp.]